LSINKKADGCEDMAYRSISNKKIGAGTFDKIIKIIIAVIAVLNLFPLYWMLSNSLMPQTFVIKVPPEFFPKNFTLENYIALFQKYSALRWTLNTIFVAGAAAALICIVSSMAGYAFAKKEFWGKNVIFWILISALMIPYQVLLVPLFKLMFSLDLVDKYPGIFLPSVAFPFGMFLMKQFISTLPTELLEASRIDGCREWGTFLRIILPLSKPGIGALAIFSFVKVWNDYVWQLIIIRSNHMKTLQLGIASLQMEKVPNIGMLMAGAVVAALPMAAVFLLFQSYFTKGITMGAVKG